MIVLWEDKGSTSADPAASQLPVSPGASSSAQGCFPERHCSSPPARISWSYDAGEYGAQRKIIHSKA